MPLLLRMAVLSIGAALLLALAPGLALAHAAPVGLNPPHGAKLDQSPPELRIRLTQPVEIGFSRVVVRSGRREIGRSDALRLEEDRMLIRDLPPLEPGRYDVSWRVLSVDGHVTEGSFSFTVLQGAGSEAGSGAGSGSASGVGSGLGPVGREPGVQGLAGAIAVVLVGALSLLLARILQRRARQRSSPQP